MSVSLGLEDFRSHLALKGYRSRSQACCLETVNIAKIWLCKTSVIQQVFSVVLVSKKFGYFISDSATLGGTWKLEAEMPLLML